jgi:hypothetical protein
MVGVAVAQQATMELIGAPAVSLLQEMLATVSEHTHEHRVLMMERVLLKLK